MAKATYSLKLFRHFVGFALKTKEYWLVPLVLFLAIAAMLVVVSQGAAPLIYTLF